MKMLAFGAVLAATAISSPTLACDGYTVNAVQVGDQSYDPAQVTPQLVQVAVEISSMPRDCVQLGLTLRAKDDAGRIALRRAGDFLQSRPVRSSRSLSANEREIRFSADARRDLAEGERIIVDLLEIPSGQFQPIGDYIAEMEWVVEGRPSQSFQIAMRVEPTVRFVGDAVRRLSLGEVSDGGEATSTFFYATNANLRITARSEHGGRLQHEFGPAFGSIPYIAHLSGQRLDLQSPALIHLPYNRTTLKSEQLKVEVPPQPRRYAGSYRDNLILDFIAY